MAKADYIDPSLEDVGGAQRPLVQIFHTNKIMEITIVLQSCPALEDLKG